MILSLASVPVAENMSAYLATRSALFFIWLPVIFRYLQKYGLLSSLRGGLSGAPSIGCPFSAKSATTASLAAHGFPAFPEDEGNNYKGSNRISPPNVSNRVDSKANQ